LVCGKVDNYVHVAHFSTDSTTTAAFFFFFSSHPWHCYLSVVCFYKMILPWISAHTTQNQKIRLTFNFFWTSSTLYVLSLPFLYFFVFSMLFLTKFIPNFQAFKVSATYDNLFLSPIFKFFVFFQHHFCQNSFPRKISDTNCLTFHNHTWKSKLKTKKRTIQT